eukprot:1783308-Rhodomonas_salina.1
MASIGRTEGVSSIPFANRFLARALKCADMFQVVSIGVMKIKGMKGFKLSPAALAGPNADAWKVHAQKMGSSVGYWVVAGLVLLCAGGCACVWRRLVLETVGRTDDGGDICDAGCTVLPNTKHTALPCRSLTLTPLSWLPALTLRLRLGRSLTAAAETEADRARGSLSHSIASTHGSGAAINGSAAAINGSARS